MFVNVLSILCFAIMAAFGDESYWKSTMVPSYVHQSELQRRWAISCLAPHLKTLKGNERVLDIGCGDGKITADISRFVPQGMVIGIDPSAAMLAWAQKQYHPAEYPNLRFQAGEFQNPGLTEPFDLIVSFCALQHGSDQESALQNIANYSNQTGSS